ncbi:MAG: TlpA family protein disulfide reductase [Thermoleophilia bacterium]|nr:TlpA family protein disulfide reductase [Thermoleophilia bacterium]
MSNRSFLAVIAALAVIALLAFGVFKTEPSLAVGDPAPDVALPVLGESGEAAIADYAPSWVLVNFWASWCGPCESESPDIQSFLEDHEGDGLVVLGINSRDATDNALAFIDEHKLTWEMVRDGDGKRMEEYGIPGLPESFLVDPEGDLAAICRGPLTRRQLDQIIGPVLRGAQPAAANVPPFCEV